MTHETPPARTLSNLLAARLLPHRFLAEQLRKPSGRFGRWVMTRGLNDGNAELIEATLVALELRGEQRFLDVGFGGGLALQRAAELTTGMLWGIDFSADMVAAGQRSLRPLIAAGRLQLLTADVTDLPLRDGLIDALCTTNTLYFWSDLPRALAELRRVLSPMGRIAFGYTGRAKMQRFDAITRHGFTTYEPSDVERALTDAGFVVQRTDALSGAVTRGDYVTLAQL